MARNKFDIDETLETPFDIRHLKRALVYAGKYKGRIAKALMLSAVAVIIGLISPLITQYAIDNCMRSTDDIPMLIVCAAAFLLCDRLVVAGGEPFEIKADRAKSEFADENDLAEFLKSVI